MKKWAGGQMDRIGTSVDNWNNESYQRNCEDFLKYISIYKDEHKIIKQGGGSIAIEKQHNKKRLTARERIDYLKDKDWHILYWGCEPNKDSDPNPIRETEVDFIVRVLSTNLTHAMTYNRDFAINLVKNFPQNMDVGEWIAWIKEHQPLDKYLHSHLIKGKCYVPHKICACQYNGYSDIDCLHNDRKDVIEKAFKENTLI